MPLLVLVAVAIGVTVLLTTFLSGVYVMWETEDDPSVP